MKHTTISLLTTLAFFVCCLALRAAPLASDTLVYVSPTTTASVTGTLAAGTVPQPVTSPTTLALPPGWQAFERDEAQDCWARDSDLDKELNVKPGTLLYAAASVESPVVATMSEGDLSELRNIQGRWVQVHYTKRIIGYYQTGTAAADRSFIDRSKTDFVVIQSKVGQQVRADINTGDTLPPGTKLIPVQPQVTTTTTGVTTPAVVATATITVTATTNAAVTSTATESPQSK